MRNNEQTETPIEWRTDVAPLGQRLVVLSLAKVMAVALAIMALLVAFLSAATGESAPFVPLLKLMARTPRAAICQNAGSGGSGFIRVYAGQ